MSVVAELPEATIWHFRSKFHLPLLRKLMSSLIAHCGGQFYLITSNSFVPQVETCPLVSVLGSDLAVDVVSRPQLSDLAGLDEVLARQLVSERLDSLKEGLPVVAMISQTSFVVIQHGTDTIRAGEISVNGAEKFPVPSDNQSLFKEYELLKDGITIISSAKHGLSMALRNVPAEKPVELETLARLNRIRQKQSTEWFYTPTAPSENNDDSPRGISFQIVQFLQSVSDIQHASTQRSLDFSEKLWMFSQKAISMEDLIETFTAVANELETGRLKPMIHKTNESKFANLVRECYRSDSVSHLFDELLDQENILSYLIEMGIDKLKRDLFYLLINKNLVAIEEFESFFATSSISESIFRLFVFQRILEPWQMLKDNVLTIPPEYERKMIHSALQYWYKRLDSIDFTDLNQIILYEFNCGKYSKWAQEFSKLLQSNYTPQWSWYEFSDKDSGDQITLAKDEAGTELICSISSF